MKGKLLSFKLYQSLSMNSESKTNSDCILTKPSTSFRSLRVLFTYQFMYLSMNDKMLYLVPSNRNDYYLPFTVSKCGRGRLSDVLTHRTWADPDSKPKHD